MSGPGGGEGSLEPRSLKSAAGLLFASFDADHDLQVTRAELTAGIAAAFSRFDVNGDKDLSPLEFDAFAKQALDDGRSPPFRLDFDRDVDGKITPKEFAAELAASFDSLDSDKDRVLSHAELLKAFEQNAPRRAPGGERRSDGPPGGADSPGGRGGPPRR